ncbi:hypothetical protein F4808DRAFT_427957 [Astrocystis sublimbata]|nr:hypothetical protein F4808DRAFT_427957 [Astrocystis sublimbata]
MNPPAVTREVIPNPLRPPTTIVHGDLHLGNIMFGEYDAEDATQPSCHRGVPVLKIIDFGMTEEQLYPPLRAQREHLRYVGDLMQQLANLAPIDLAYGYDDDRPRFMVRDIPTLGHFETYLDEAMYTNRRRFSDEFRGLLAWCLAARPGSRPTVNQALDFCEHFAAQTANWRHLAEEVSEIFDIVPLDIDGHVSGSEYEPTSSGSNDDL